MEQRNEKGQFIKGFSFWTGKKRPDMIGNVLGKGLIPWNAGKKGLQVAWNKGKKTGLIPKNGFKKGEKPHNYKGGKNRLPKCIDCGKRLSRIDAKKCKSCFDKDYPARREMGKLTKGRKYPEHSKGKNHHRWKGGTTPENKKIRHSIEFRLWREAVFARDNWTCQKTGGKGGKLHPHHIQNFSQYPELRFAIDNGITLSDKAHWEFHKIYGMKNNTREQLEEFLK